MRLPTVLVFAATLGSALVAHAQSQVAVTTCGQVVPPKTVGYLTGNLDCTGSTDLADVMLSRGASFDLRGFTLSGGDGGVACIVPCPNNPGVFCNTGSRCRVFGGGTITGSVHGVTGQGNRPIDIEGVSISNESEEAVFNASRVTFTNATITGNAYVLWAVTAAKLKQTTVTGNAIGIQANRIAMFASTATGNGDFDIESTRKPSLHASVCDISRRPPQSNASWHVCQGD